MVSPAVNTNTVAEHMINVEVKKRRIVLPEYGEKSLKKHVSLGVLLTEYGAFKPQSQIMMISALEGRNRTHGSINN